MLHIPRPSEAGAPFRNGRGTQTEPLSTPPPYSGVEHDHMGSLTRAGVEHIPLDSSERCHRPVGYMRSPCILYKGHRTDGSSIRCRSTIPDDDTARNPTGTCQCCFRTQKVVRGAMTLHGYKRPGTGYIIGNCRGTGYVPYEVSCEQTKVFRGEIEQMREAKRAALARLQARPDTVRYSTSIYVGYGHPRAESKRSPYAPVWVDIAKGTPPGWAVSDIVATRRSHHAAGPVVNVGDFEQFDHPGYDKVLDHLIGDVERLIERMTDDIDFLAGKIAEWTPIPLKEATA